MWHRLSTEKDDDTDKNFENFRELNFKYFNTWAILADKSYSGLQADIQVIILNKNLVNNVLSLTNRFQNNKVLHERVIVESIL